VQGRKTHEQQLRILEKISASDTTRPTSLEAMFGKANFR
jgi:hypothetical protein